MCQENITNCQVLEASIECLFMFIILFTYSGSGSSWFKSMLSSPIIHLDVVHLATWWVQVMWRLFATSPSSVFPVNFPSPLWFCVLSVSRCVCFTGHGLQWPSYLSDCLTTCFPFTIICCSIKHWSFFPESAKLVHICKCCVQLFCNIALLWFLLLNMIVFPAVQENIVCHPPATSFLFVPTNVLDHLGYPLHWITYSPACAFSLVLLQTI